MKTFLLLAAFFVVAVPVAYAVPPGGQGATPSQLCKEQLQAMGPVYFQSQYAPNGNAKNAFGKCVAWQAQLAQTNAANAAKACKLERGTTAESIAAFNEHYGAAKNAFGKCVSQNAAEATEEQQEATISAAKTCKGLRGTTAQSIATFNADYGTTKNKKNAFGQCVKQNQKPAQ